MAKKRNRSTKKRKQIKSSTLRTRPGSEAAGAAGSVVSVSSVEQFEQYLDAPEPVLVDFWAPWCGPCRMMAPEFEQAAGALAGRVRFLKVNTEQLPDLAGAFGIRSIPTVLALHGRDVVDSSIGVTRQASLQRMAQRALDQGNHVPLGQRLKRLLGRSDSAPAQQDPANSATP